jgi:hypothetical protein
LTEKVMLIPETLGPKSWQNTKALLYHLDRDKLESLPTLFAAQKIKLVRIATVPGRHHWHLQKGWGSVLFRARTSPDLSGLELETAPAPGILRRSSSVRLQKQLDTLLLKHGAHSRVDASGPAS